MEKQNEGHSFETETAKETVSPDKPAVQAPQAQKEVASTIQDTEQKTQKVELKKPDNSTADETAANTTDEKVKLQKSDGGIVGVEAAKEDNTNIAENSTAASAEKVGAEGTDEKTAGHEPTKADDNTAEETSADDDESDIVFAGDSIGLPEQSPHKLFNKKNEMPETAAEGDDVIFADASENQPKSRIKRQREKKKFPVGAIVAVASVAVAAAAGGLVAWSISRNNVETAADVQTASAVSSPDLSVVSKPDADIADTSDPSEEELDLDTIDTTNILFGENVTVEGVNLAGKSLSQAYDTMQDRLLEIREPISITVVCDGKSLTLTQNDFVFDSNIASVLVQAYHYSRGELNNPTVESTFDGKVTDFKVDTAINTESVDAAIEKTAAFYDVQPVNAHVTKFDPNATQKFEYADGADGFLVDHDELSKKIKAILDSGDKSGSVSIVTHQTPFKITLADIKANTRLIASHSTTASNVYNSVYNMELAIKAANGTVVMPGEKFSFNAMTGDTTNGNEHRYENGTTGAYLPSTAYSQGKVVQEYGGGICQASTTMYLCAVKANMEITDRYAHMYASSYAPYGLDATVDYGNLDMSFINPTEYPVYIATYVYDYNGDGLDELCVEMYGPLSEEYDEIVPVGWVTYAGDKGFSARGAKVFFKNGQEVKRENLPSGSYDYHYENYYTVINYMPSDISYGPSASATWSSPAVYSPYGVGENGPVAYGTAQDVLKKARATR